MKKNKYYKITMPIEDKVFNIIIQPKGYGKTYHKLTRLNKLKQDLIKDNQDLEWLNDYDGQYPPIYYMNQGKIELIDTIEDYLK